MKKIIKTIITLACTIGLFASTFCPVLASEGLDQKDTENIVERREILTSTSTGIYYYGKCAVKVTITYTYRFEASNTSKRYITGILYGTFSNYTGWTSISNGTVDVNSVTYTNNNQNAYIPFSYYGSVGAGNNTYVSQVYYLRLN